jgi:hypothetical protein
MQLDVYLLGDSWAWTWEKHGNYSVKLAYRLLMSKANEEEKYAQCNTLIFTSKYNSRKIIYVNK